MTIHDKRPGSKHWGAIWRTKMAPSGEIPPTEEAAADRTVNDAAPALAGTAAAISRGPTGVKATTGGAL